jgi:hypothetical protein
MRKATLVLVLLGLVLSALPVLAAPTLTDVVVPQYLEAANSSTRLPTVFRVTLSGLTANATYRYFHQAVISTDAATVSGAGNPIFLDASYCFYSTGPAMTTVGTTCSQFTTDATGSYTGWFGLVGTGNARFTAGNVIYLRIMLNDGAGGTSIAARVTTTLGVTCIAFGATASDGTGIYAQPGYTAKDVVLLYDNQTGSGRPLSAGIVQNEGITLPSAVAFYSGSVDGVAGAWGTIIPNTLPGGVLRIEERAFADGGIVQYLSDLDGIWNPGAISTVNPAGGTTAINLTGVTTEQPVEVLPMSFGHLKNLYR